MAKLTCNFISYTLKRAVDLTVILPSVTLPLSSGENGNPPTHAHKPYPVLYLLHGYGNNNMTWNGYTRIELYAEERQIAVVMPSADNKAYFDHGGDDNYFQFISEELPNFIENNFNVSTRKEDTYLAGLSMGGYGVAIHAFSHPEKYQAIGIFSGLLIPKDKRLQPSQLLKEAIKQNKQLPDIYLSIGNDDFLLDMNHKFVKLLKKLDVKHTSKFEDGYAHEWRFWDKEVELFLDWIKRSDAYANTKRIV